MSKIKLYELNTAELNSLNDGEMDEVVGGSVNSQSAAIVSNTSNTLANLGIASGVNVTQAAVSFNVISQTLSDVDTAAIVGSIFAGIGG